MMPSSRPAAGCLILGIGNLLLGAEGIGVHVAREAARRPLPPGVACLDGGTGGFHLLEALQGTRRVVLVDAVLDGGAPGAVRRLVPRFSSDYPRTLTAHDIGLKDLIDALYLLGDPPEIVLYAVSIGGVGDPGTELPPELERIVPGLAARVVAEAAGEPDAAAPEP